MREVKEFLQYLDYQKADVAYNLDDFEDDLETGTFMRYSEEFCKVMKVQRINTWICADTRVGVFCVFL